MIEANYVVNLTTLNNQKKKNCMFSLKKKPIGD